MTQTFASVPPPPVAGKPPLTPVGSIIIVDHIRIWNQENCVWPWGVAIIATATYTLWRTMALHWERATFSFAGELIGAGGMLLGTVMLASTEARTKEWIAELHIPDKPTAIDDEIALNVRRGGELIPVLQWISILLGICLAGVHVSLEHNNYGNRGWIISVLLLVANLTYLVAIRIWCHNRMYRVKTALMLSDIHKIKSAKAAGMVTEGAAH